MAELLICLVGLSDRRGTLLAEKEVRSVAGAPKVQEGNKVTIFVASITLKNGKRIYAAAYGLQAFPLKIRKAA